VNGSAIVPGGEAAEVLHSVETDLTPKRIFTDKLRSYGAARRDVIPLSNIDSTKARTIARRIPTCRFENEND
jgi:transposase-like protein